MNKMKANTVTNHTLNKSGKSTQTGNHFFTNKDHQAMLISHTLHKDYGLVANWI